MNKGSKTAESLLSELSKLQGKMGAASGEGAARTSSPDTSSTTSSSSVEEGPRTKLELLSVLAVRSLRS